MSNHLAILGSLAPKRASRALAATASALVTAFATAAEWWQTPSPTTQLSPKDMATTLLLTRKAGPYVPPPIPEDWQTVPHSYTFEGKEKTFDLVKANAIGEENGVVIFSMGWYSPPGREQHQTFVRALQEAGLTVFMMPLTGPEDVTSNAYSENLARQKATVFDKKSPIHKYARDKLLPVSLLTHSTSGNLYKNNLEQTPRDKMPEIQLAILSATFLAPANASPEFPVNEAFFVNAYAPLNGRKTASETIGGRWYHFANDMLDNLIKDHPSTFAAYNDILDIRKSGIPFLDRKRKKPAHGPDEIHITDKTDPYTCTTTTIRAAKNWLLTGPEVSEKEIDQRIWTTKGANHYPHLHFMQQIISAIQEKNAQWHHDREAHAYDADVAPYVFYTDFTDLDPEQP